jgi:hypothetical protein
MKKGILILVGILGFLIESKAQELDFRVIINSDRSRFQSTDVFSQMKTSFEQFLNGRTWTSDEFRPEERIKGNLLITINQVPQIGVYSATVQVQVVRPVYGTNYETVVLNFIDRNWSFEYQDSQPLEFNRVSFFLEREEVIGLFTKDELIISMAKRVLYIAIFLELGRSMNFVFIQSLRSAGDTVFPVIMAVISMFGINVVLSHVFAIEFEMGLVGIFIAGMLDEIVRGTAMAIRWKQRKWSKIKLIETV